ncbi:MAG: glycosyltransferase family 2 protein [Pyrinomonadaceae bacterium]|nr:glycosyltransferase family 2 protein [Pyrinomonadaceae bacterium]
MDKLQKITVVTPTFHRPDEIAGLIEDLEAQTFKPFEMIVVDGAPLTDRSTERVVNELIPDCSFRIEYRRHKCGTAVQRNFGIEIASGDLIALIDDDVRPAPDFLEKIADVFASDKEQRIGGVTGYRTNQYFAKATSARWQWYRKLRLLRQFEPGRFDFECGYPINNNLQPPFKGVRKVDFMTTACTVWRRQVFDGNLRFDLFFRDYGVLEDAHFSLRAGKKWTLLQCGDAHCRELRSPNGRTSRRRIGYKCVVNYYYVFRDAAGPLSLGQKFRFWRFQLFEVLRISTSAIRRRRFGDIQEAVGRLHGALAVVFGAARVQHKAVEAALHSKA